MTGNMNGGLSTTDGTSRWDNKLATPAYMTDRKGGKPLRAFHNGSGLNLDDNR